MALLVRIPNVLAHETKHDSTNVWSKFVFDFAAPAGCKTVGAELPIMTKRLAARLSWLAALWHDREHNKMSPAKRRGIMASTEAHMSVHDTVRAMIKCLQRLHKGLQLEGLTGVLPTEMLSKFCTLYSSVKNELLALGEKADVDDKRRFGVLARVLHNITVAENHPVIAVETNVFPRGDVEISQQICLFMGRMAVEVTTIVGDYESNQTLIDQDLDARIDACRSGNDFIRLCSSSCGSFFSGCSSLLAKYVLELRH